MNDNSDQDNTIDNIKPYKNNNMPFSHEEPIEIRSADINCCMCFDLDRGLQLTAFVAFVDLCYTLGNMLFGMLFYIVGKSEEVSVASNGQL